MDPLEVIRVQRACRTFSPEPVPEDVVSRVLEAATFAPSAENSQPWVFVVLEEEEAREQIGLLTRRVWEDGARAHAEATLPPALLADVDRGATGAVAAAPVLVVVGVDTARVAPGAVGASVWPAVQNLLLAATALGLGSALTTLAAATGDELAALVGFPEDVRAACVVPLGRPARPLGPPRRRPLTEVAHRGRYGVPWPR